MFRGLRPKEQQAEWKFSVANMGLTNWFNVPELVLQWALTNVC
jgi:hypothetical protein